MLRQRYLFSVYIIYICRCIGEVCIQSLFLLSAAAPHGFVVFSIGVGGLNGCLSVALIVALWQVILHEIISYYWVFYRNFMILCYID